MINFLKHSFLHPLKEFLHDSKAIGIILLLCTFISLSIANTNQFGVSYCKFWDYHFLNSIHISLTPKHIISDILMCIFFFSVAMEIKREIVFGELSTLKKASLPFFGALGGMVIPAFIFLLFNINTLYQKAWAIPTATDIAFSIGIASFLGKKVSQQLKIFLLALAIIDDLGAIVIIAFFYSNHLNYNYLFFSIICSALIFIISNKKNSFGLVQIILTLILVFLLHKTGIHTTIAGVIAAFAVPKEQLNKWLLKVHNLSNFIVLPLFVLSSTAISINLNQNIFEFKQLFLGISLGLILGKPIGVFCFSFISCKLNISQLPNQFNNKDLWFVGLLASIGFTMSIFVSTLAFNDLIVQDICKITIIISTLLSSVLCLVLFQLKK